MSSRDEPSPRGLPPVRKSLGQHFLNDRRILQRIVDALELTGTETVVEIGPGRGSLTAMLVPHVRRLVLIEYDRALAARLREKYASTPSVEIVEADVLTVDLGAVTGEPFRLVGNVPYYITTPILFHALERPRPERAVYLVQREVAERIVAAPGLRRLRRALGKRAGSRVGEAAVQSGARGISAAPQGRKRGREYRTSRRPGRPAGGGGGVSPARPRCVRHADGKAAPSSDPLALESVSRER